jgi:hypothetical protein
MLRVEELPVGVFVNQSPGNGYNKETDQIGPEFESEIVAPFLSHMPELSSYIEQNLLFRYIVEKDACQEEMWTFYTNRGPAALATYIKERLREKRVYEKSKCYPELMKCFARPTDRFKVQDRGINLSYLEMIRMKCEAAGTMSDFQQYICGLVE